MPAEECYTRQQERGVSTINGFILLEDGVRLYFEKLGDGSPTVLIPNGIYLMDDFRRLATGRTMIFYDVRNRGRSDSINDPVRLARGVEQDVDDLDAVRRHFGIGQVELIGHSYIGLMVALYAVKYSPHLGRVVQIGPAQPDAAKQYPAHLTGADATFAGAMAEIGRMVKDPPAGDPQEVCKKFWSVLRVIFVVNPADAERIDWGRCDLPNERNFRQYWIAHLWPSIQRLHLTAEDFAKVTAPVLIVHGTKDRNAPYGGAMDWATSLPNARLVTVQNAAHAPWIEAPELVFGSIDTFLAGAWPELAKKVSTPKA